MAKKNSNRAKNNKNSMNSNATNNMNECHGYKNSLDNNCSNSNSCKNNLI